MEIQTKKEQFLSKSTYFVCVSMVYPHLVHSTNYHYIKELRKIEGQITSLHFLF